MISEKEKPLKFNLRKKYISPTAHHIKFALNMKGTDQIAFKLAILMTDL